MRISARAKVAELVDALDLGSSVLGRGGSSPPLRTMRSAHQSLDRSSALSYGKATLTYYSQVCCEMKTVTPRPGGRPPLIAVRWPSRATRVALPQPSGAECVAEFAATGEDR